MYLYGLTSSDVLGSCALLISTAIPSFFAWRANGHAKAAHDEVRTNHGKRAGEYLEQIAEVSVTAEMQRARLDQMVRLLQVHTEDDATRFTEMTTQITQLRADVAHDRQLEDAATAKVLLQNQQPQGTNQP